MSQLLWQVKRLLRIEEDETRLVFLFFGLAMSLGFFHISFEICSTTLFLELFDKAELSQALFISGLIGLSLTFLYSKLQAWISFSGLLIGTFTFLATVPILLYLLAPHVGNRPLAFLLFILMGPLCIVSIISYWGLAGRLFSMRQGKRLFGLVYSGQLFAVILLSAATGPVLGLIGHITNFLLISCLAVALGLLFLVAILWKYRDLLRAEKELQQSSAEEAGKLTILFKNRYVTIMAVFVILSMISAFFIYFSFLSVTRIKYPDPDELAAFLGAFIAFANIFSFAIRSFVYNKIIENYGLKVTLMLVPILLGLFTLLAIVVGTFFGTSPENESFIFFFILIALSRLMYLTLRESVQLQTFEIMYQSLNKSIRFLVQAAIDGMVNEFAAIFSGVLLVSLSFMSGFGILHYSYLLFAFIAVWTYVAARLYREYHASLERSLAETKNSQIETVDSTSAFIQQLMFSGEAADQIKALSMARLVSAEKLHQNMSGLLYSPHAEVRTMCLNTVAENMMLPMLSEIKQLDATERDKKVKIKLTEVCKTFDQYSDTIIRGRSVNDLQRSVQPSDRLAALIVAEQLNSSATDRAVSILLRDMVPPVRRAAIEVAGRLQKAEFLPALAENILVPQYSDYAADAILNYSDSAVHLLEQTFNKSGADTESRLLIISILARINTPQATEYIADKLTYPQRQIVLAAVSALKKLDFVPSDTQSSILNGIIHEAIGVAAWNISACCSALELNVPTYLQMAMEQEVLDSQRRVFDGLAALYDARSISYVQENVESEHSEKINYALELLDLFVAEDLKKQLFALFDDYSYAEKSALLADYYPKPNFDRHGLLDALITRDATMISRWTALCAMRSYYELGESQCTDAVIAHTFNPNPVFQEIALFLVRKTNETLFNKIISRYSRSQTEELRRKERAFGLNGGYLSVLKALEQLDKFNEIPDNERFALISSGKIQSFDAENIIELDSASAFVLVLSGAVAFDGAAGNSQNSPTASLVSELLFSPQTSILRAKVPNTQLFTITSWEWKRVIRQHCTIAEAASNYITIA